MCLGWQGFHQKTETVQNQVDLFNILAFEYNINYSVPSSAYIEYIGGCSVGGGDVDGEIKCLQS